MKTKLSYLVALCAFTSSLFAPPMTLEQRVAETEDRLDAIEFQSGLDKIKFGLDFSTGASESSYKITEFTSTNPITMQKSTTPEQKYKAHNKWGMELNLNMNAPINSYTKFYGRLSMSKNYGMMDNRQTNNPNDLDAGRDFRTSGQSLYVSRAYVDLFFSPEIVATLGRQPGTEGPGSNLRNNALRQSTYPALLFNALGDAAVLSYKPSFARQLQFVVRGAYGKIYQFDEESGTVRDWTTGSKNMADTDLYYAAFEIQPYLGMVGKRNLFMVSYARLHDLALNLSSINDAIGVQNLGTIDSINVHFESYEAFRFPLHYFVSASYMKGSKARNISFTAQVPKADTTSGSISNNPTPFNLGKLFNKETAYAIHAGFRYDFHRYFKLGAEYFHGSQYWFAFSRLSFNDPLNIRNTRGQAYDVYIISQIDRNQFFRLSYTHIQNKWSNRGLPLGGAYGKDEKEKGGYESTADSIMLVYNVKF